MNNLAKKIDREESELAFTKYNREEHVTNIVLGRWTEPSDDLSLECVAVHECGHAMAFLVNAVDFHHVEVFEKPHGFHGVCEPRGVRVEHRGAGLECRLASDVAGAIAEELIYRQVGGGGVETDFRVALARVGIDDPENVTEDDHRLAPIRDAVARVEAMLRRRRRALMALAEELARARSLTRLECVRIVNANGSHVRVRPLFSPTLPQGELDACDRVRDELASVYADENARARAIMGKQKKTTGKDAGR